MTDLDLWPHEVQALQDLADEGLPMTGEDLKLYREVSAAWPPDKRNHANPWEVHRILAKHPDRFELIKQPMDEWRARILALQHLTNGAYPRNLSSDPITVYGDLSPIDSNHRSP